ncbi:threonine ammonia-lyase IlvA [Ascidiimonas aurantiaca]|uniref:threonine ammonia-lyase IlvA n=1 Tax=Ascidiimonas aurantiaca TaxID=1685432 RepID=UPI0030EF4D7A
MKVNTTYIPTLEDVTRAASVLHSVVRETPLTYNKTYSDHYGAQVFLKREDLQEVRSYKIRGAYHKIYGLSETQKAKGIVCASAGNHAQGVALSCKKLGIKGTIYMPVTTPGQKIDQVLMFGGAFVDIVLQGDTFDEANEEALKICKQQGKEFVHPFDDERIIEGQATVALEILHQSTTTPDYLFVPVGGGGLIAGTISIIKALSPDTKVVGVEPKGAASMKTSLLKKENVLLEKIDKFVDGAAVQRVGNKTFEICKQLLPDMVTVDEGLVCQTILDLYNKDAIVVEPAGALTLAALETYRSKIKNKNIVCVVSGSNNDITRTAEIKERALLYANLKHYFIVRFPQRAGALKQFVAEILGPDDDITHFEYSKKHSREKGPAVVGIELKKKEDLYPLIERMKVHNFYGDYLNDKPDLFQFLV